MSKAFDLAVASIKEHEGCRLVSYQDSRGVWTAGWGRNLQAMVISQEVADQWFAEDVASAHASASTLVSNWNQISEERKAVLTEMVFQLGLEGTEKFHAMRGAIEAGAWDRAADEMLNSLWAEQTPQRALVLSSRMRASVETGLA